MVITILWDLYKSFAINTCSSIFLIQIIEENKNNVSKLFQLKGRPFLFWNVVLPIWFFWASLIQLEEGDDRW